MKVAQRTVVLERIKHNLPLAERMLLINALMQGNWKVGIKQFQMQKPTSSLAKQIKPCTFLFCVRSISKSYSIIFQDNFMLDMYLSPHVHTLYSQIRNRALVQVRSVERNANLF